MGAYDSPGAVARYQQQGGVRYNPPNNVIGSAYKFIGTGGGKGKVVQISPPPVGINATAGGRPPSKKAVTWQTGMDAVPVQYRQYTPWGYGAQPPARPEQFFGSPVIYGGGGAGKGRNDWNNMRDVPKSWLNEKEYQRQSIFDWPNWRDVPKNWLNELLYEPEVESDPVYYGGGYGGGWGGWGGYGGGGYKSPFDFFFNRLNWRI